MLEELPVINRGVSSLHPADPGQQFSVTLANGTAIVLHDFYQFCSYAGYLEGIPHPYYALLNAIDAAKREFAYSEGVFTALPPTIYAGTFAAEDERIDWIAMPPVCCIGHFQCERFPDDESLSPSSAIVIWFQNQFGLDLDQRTLTQLRSLDWPSIAQAWEF
jgi:hypothetical protein